MLASEIVLLGTAVVTLITTIAASSCCVCRRSTDKYTIDVLKDKRRVLRGLVREIRDQKGEAIATRKQSEGIKKAEDLLESGRINGEPEKAEDKCSMCGLVRSYWAQMLARTKIKDQVLKLDIEIENAEDILHQNMKGKEQLDEVKIVGKKRVEAAEEIWKLVSGQEQYPEAVCIHGIFGVGKTAIAKYIHNKALKDDGDVFDCVMWVSLKYGAGIRQVQDGIASILGLNLSLQQEKNNNTSAAADNTAETVVGRDEENRRRAEILEKALNQKKFLLVLDSMWQPLSLTEIGIPKLGKERKLIVTSRISRVCDGMGRTKKYEILPLPNSEEAWELFVYEMGSPLAQRLKDKDETVSRIKSVLTVELDGLPLAIIMLARRLGNQQEELWKKELDGLAANPIYLHTYDQGPLHRFKQSFQDLEATTRSCFMFCALFPKDHWAQTSKLIEYWMCEGLLGHDTQALEEIMKRGLETLDELKNAHLLQTQSGGEMVKMLNLVQSMAIHTMGTEGKQVYIKSGCFLPSLGSTKGWNNNVERVSVMKNQLRDIKLHNTLICEQLSTLLLQDNPLDLGLHERFFDSMPNLRVLDLSHTFISVLPDSLSELKILHALLLRTCQNLKNLPNLSNLQQLLVLDVSGRPLESCPQGIQEMKKLKRLNLSHTRFKTFPANIGSQLKELEELLMITSHDGGCLWGSNEMEAKWEDLLKLDSINVLHLNFLNTQVFNMYIEKAVQEIKLPPRFRFCVGGFQSSRRVGDNSMTIIDSHRFMPPDTTLELHLLRCSERIHVLELEKRSLSNLEVLYVSDLSGIMYLLTVDIFQSLNQLTELHVRKCKQMLEVVKPDEEGNPPTIKFPRLTKLALFDLPKLTSVCYGTVLDCPALCSPDVSKCDKLVRPNGLIIHSETIDNHPGTSNSNFNGPTSEIETALANAVPSSSCCVNICATRKADKYKMEQLKKRQRALLDLIEVANRKVEKAVVTQDLSCFIREADSFVRKVNESIKETEKGIDDKCMSGMLPNIRAQKQARTRMENTSAELKCRIEEGKELVRKPVKGYKQPREVAIVGKKRREIAEDIWKKLLVVEGVAAAGAICIHGATGVGETAIAKCIHNRALDDPGEPFNYVIWVDVQYGAGGVWQIQEAIANSLDIDLSQQNTPNPRRDGDSVKKRADILRNALLERGRFLLVVDSVLKPLCLDDIGIPELVSGRKLIVTCRIRSVLDKIASKMIMFDVQPLPGVDEAWELFEKDMGLTLARYAEVYGSFRSDIERVLLAQLDGLPLAINELAETLLCDDGQKAYLDCSSPKQQQWHLELRTTDLFHRFEDSCDNLEEVTRNCFLHLALLPKSTHGILGKELIEYWMWEGLLGDLNNVETFEEGLEKGRHALDQLLDAHLLEGTVTTPANNDHTLVRMLNVFRTAIGTRVTNAGNGVFLKSAASLTRLPLERDWPPGVEKASFTQNQIKALRLQKEPTFNTLSTLLLQDNPLSLKCDPYFFYSMPNLRFLDVSRTNISALPKSFSSLKILQTLILQDCANLRSLPDMSNLRDLMVLDLSGTGLELWPQGIENMKKLRRLNLSQTKLATFPANVVGRLTELEELLVLTDLGCVWGSKKNDKSGEGACIEELLDLRKLVVLELHLLDSAAFDMYVKKAEENEYTNYNVPPKFRFRVGELQNGGNAGQNSLVIHGGPSITLPNSTLELQVMLYRGKKLKLDGCLMDLNVLDVSNCDDLKYLFSADILGSLKSLRKICVRRCEKMTKVIKPASVYNPAKLYFPELTTLVFFDLQILESVCCGLILDCPRLSSIQVWWCPRLKLPMISNANCRKIEIQGHGSWFNNTSWDNPGNSNSLFQGTPQSNPNLRFFEAPVPPELEATSTSTTTTSNDSVLSQPDGWTAWFWSWMGATKFKRYQRQLH